MTEIKSMPVTQVIDYKNSKFIEPFEFYSGVLNQWCVIPIGFITDWESIPIIRGTSKISGCIHDYLCRYDSVPTISKIKAAQVYLEFLLFRSTLKWVAYIKYLAVIVAKGYFHKRGIHD